LHTESVDLRKSIKELGKKLEEEKKPSKNGPAIQRVLHEKELCTTGSPEQKVEGLGPAEKSEEQEHQEGNSNNT
jgi:hypothetical protein